MRKARQGMTAIEYGVFAAFIVLVLVGAAVAIGPKLSTWLQHTITCITTGKSDGDCKPVS